MLRAVIFDLWETLITDTPEAAQAQEALRLAAMERILAARGLPATAERIDRAYRGLWNRCYELYWSKDRDITTRRQIDHFLADLDLAPESFPEEALAEMEHAYANATFEVPPHVVPGALEALAGARARGLRIGLVSNTGRTPGATLRLVLEANGMASAFDALVFSNEHGECKPQRSIFEKVLRLLGVEAGEAAFVGDNAYVDVHGAQSCGMLGILFEPARRGTAVARERDHGVEIVPDATLTDLAKLPEILDELAAAGKVTATGAGSGGSRAPAAAALS